MNLTKHGLTRPKEDKPGRTFPNLAEPAEILLSLAKSCLKCPNLA